MAGRALHYVFKVADRTHTVRFYREILGMQILRHEEFTRGCEAACNGPYDNRWSKTMIGYGPEDNHFALELTYNYGLDSYKLGNDFIGIKIKSRESIARVKALKWPYEIDGDMHVINAPGGYKFFLIDEVEPKDADPVQEVILSCSNLEASKEYWNHVLGLKIFSVKPDSITLGFNENEAKLTLKQIAVPINRAEAFGRIAFSVPKVKLPEIQETVTKEMHKVLTPLIDLDTPGKATVTVVILADPDGHEICFVGDEGFRELSAYDPKGTVLLERYIKKDEERKKGK